MKSLKPKVRGAKQKPVSRLGEWLMMGKIYKWGPSISLPALRSTTFSFVAKGKSFDHTKPQYLICIISWKQWKQ